MITQWIVLMHPSGLIAGAGITSGQARDRARAVYQRHSGGEVDEDAIGNWMSVLVEGTLTFENCVALDEQVESVIPAALAIIGEEDICRRCGCRDHRPCPEGCGWAEDLLCTVCDEAGERL